MSEMTTVSIAFLEHFEALKDPRQLIKVIYPLNEILLLVLCAVISGEDTWQDIAFYGEEKLDFLRTLLPFKRGVPSHDTLGEVFSNLEPKSFQSCFLSWVESVQQSCREIVAIDGKTLRGSFEGESKAIHMVSAWACQQRMVLGQEKVEEKSNEITAIPKLLEILVLKGAIVTIDAMGCQQEIAQKILDKQADYVLALKGNHKLLHQDVTEFLIQQRQENFRRSRCDYYESTEKGHGRVEVRRCWSTDDVEWLRERHNWPGLQSIVLVESSRTVKANTTTEQRYYLSSLPMNATEAAHAIRSHWQIENSLHWVLDVVFRDDDCRVRKKHAAQNLHMVKQLVLSLLKRFPGKRSLRAKRKLAGWNNQTLLHILTFT